MQDHVRKGKSGKGEKGGGRKCKEKGREGRREMVREVEGRKGGRNTT